MKDIFYFKINPQFQDGALISRQNSNYQIKFRFQNQTSISKSKLDPEIDAQSWRRRSIFKSYGSSSKLNFEIEP